MHHLMKAEMLCSRKSLFHNAKWRPFFSNFETSEQAKKSEQAIDFRAGEEIEITGRQAS
jgi:hypothetical protein